MVSLANMSNFAVSGVFVVDSHNSVDAVGRILTNEGRRIFEVVNFVFVCGVFGMFGIAGNVINIIIFYQHGLSNTVNIALLGLAVSDLGCLITLEWISALMNPFFAISGIPWVLPDIMLLSAAWPHVCFCRIASYITVYITAERYLSIAFPLKIKQIVTPQRTASIIFIIYLVNVITLIPEYSTSYLGWRSSPHTNMTILALMFRSSRQYVEGLCYAFHSLLSSTSFLGVIFFTIVLVAKLRQSSKWRKSATTGNKESGSNISRDQKTVKMVVVIASILIFCYTPGAAVSMTTFLVGPEFSIMGRYINICVAAWSVAYSFQTFNSSVNIFFYYRMSSKYRHTFKLLLMKCSKLCGK